VDQYSRIFNRERGLTFELHADFEALLKAAVRATLPLCFVNVTGSLGDARVDLLVLDGALEETLAGLTREQTVVIARHFVATYRTQLLDDDVLRVGEIGWTRYRAGYYAYLTQTRMAQGTAAARNRTCCDAAACRGPATPAATAGIRRGWTSGSCSTDAVAVVTAAAATAAAVASFETSGSTTSATGCSIPASGSCRREQTRIHLLVGAVVEC